MGEYPNTKTPTNTGVLFVGEFMCVWNENVLRHVKCFALCFHSTVLKQSDLFLGSGLENVQKHILESLMPWVLGKNVKMQSRSSKMEGYDKVKQ